jgi:hypothetical protein
MTEKHHLLQAIRDLGYMCVHPRYGQVMHVKGIGGRRTLVEFKVKTTKKEGDIGFRKSGGTYDIIADWLTISTTTRPEFVRRVTQRYAYFAALERIEAQGFTVVKEDRYKQGVIQLVLQKKQEQEPQ